MTCRILIIEDDPVMADSISQTLKRELGDVKIELESSFKNAPETLAATMPDVVVLDLFDDSEASEEPVKPVWAVIWEKHFCPVVFHSAHDIEEYRTLSHPFVRYEIKGLGSHGRVANHIKEFASEITGLQSVRSELSQSIHETLLHVSPIVWRSGKPNAELTDMLLRSVRRRMAATLDHPTAPLTRIHAWEQYICPSIGDNLLTGDLLLAHDAEKAQPESYRLVLSPSCDLVLGRPNTVREVLVATCTKIDEFVNKTGVSHRKLADNLPSHLNKDQVAGFFPLPEFPGVFPLMAANLKGLSLIPYSDIATKVGDIKPFSRIASMDSPFRERLAWAFLQVAGRPGVPDVDVEAFAVSIQQKLRP